MSGTEPRFYGNASEKSRYNMSKIRGKNTSIEIKLRKALWRNGIHYRKNYKELPGTPDIVITKYNIAIFCDSEFFHGKDWEMLKPRLKKGANGDYWVSKISKNMERDNEIDKKLLYMGWTVVHFWGKDISKNVDDCVTVIKEIIFDLQMNLINEEE